MTLSDVILLTGAQIRAARALNRWSAEDLAKAAKLGTATIKRAEAQDGPVTSTQANVAAIIRAFRDIGIDFIFEDNIGVGVRFRDVTLTDK
ncbi:transcriptional regulator [Methylobacterium aerolatum]|uniref:Transcriptional regulator with XRE-family HTH domain n=1 Tax=Methylobacterium aerolatum TaxID=418708 RepID=A0ABU0HZP2_9HYPH|nr:transcriptional regulator [Methylobacterium aerolatum]MDQ0447818.1 transcriptional regulator with XRE-family HTH domain [Methylobacterium aerolatum]